MKIVFSLLLVTVSILAQAGRILAYEIPQFTTCVNPQGEVRASYENGTHGIAGQSGSFEGKDTVYTLSGDALTQCFCSSDGSGIQTNWWKVSSLTEQEVNVLQSQGWNYIPNGALWGLENTPYLALNSEYICKSGSGAGTGGSSSSTSSNNSSNSSSSGSGGGVLGVSSGIGAVLGLASTGNINFLLAIFSLAIISLSSGLILKKRAKNFSK